jgi:hypothetical protein
MAFTSSETPGDSAQSLAIILHSQNSCSVVTFGTRGDCMADDTAAFQKASDACGTFFVPRPAAHGCYRVNGVQLHAGSVITMEDRNTEVRPVSPETSFVFGISGDPGSQTSFVTIRNGILWAPFTMAAGTAGVRVEHANHITLEGLIVNGFYDDVFADDAEYLYLMHVNANGSAHANVWHQHTAGDGPYFGGPLYIDHSTLDSCKCSAASVWIQDIAVVNITDSDIVGVSEGQGLHAESSNGMRGSPADFPAGLHVHGATFDSIASEPILIKNYEKSDIQGTWVSGGARTKRHVYGSAIT